MMTNATVVDVSEDWAIACDVQQRFLQHSKPAINALSYSAQCRQVRAVGGNFYDFLPMPDNHIGLAIGDACGKSIAAALMISGVQSSLRTAVSFAANDIAAVVRTVNSLVHQTCLPGRYATLFYGSFDGNTRTLRYVNAGHNPPIVIREDGSIVHLETGGLPVGMFPNWDYQEGIVRLRRGDLIVAYTDGVIETMNPAGEEWGVDRLRAAARESSSGTAEHIARAIFRSMDQFSGGQQTDDATVLIARVQ